jgi:hypothetical protein
MYRLWRSLEPVSRTANAALTSLSNMSARISRCLPGNCAWEFSSQAFASSRPRSLGCGSKNWQQPHFSNSMCGLVLLTDSQLCPISHPTLLSSGSVYVVLIVGFLRTPVPPDPREHWHGDTWIVFADFVEFCEQLCEPCWGLALRQRVLTCSRLLEERADDMVGGFEGRNTCSADQACLYLGSMKVGIYL